MTTIEDPPPTDLSLSVGTVEVLCSNLNLSPHDSEEMILAKSLDPSLLTHLADHLSIDEETPNTLPLSAPIFEDQGKKDGEVNRQNVETKSPESEQKILDKPLGPLKSILKSSGSYTNKTNRVVLGESVEDNEYKDKRLKRTGTKYIKKEDCDEDIGIIQKKPSSAIKSGSLKLRNADKKAWKVDGADQDDKLLVRVRSNSVNTSPASSKKPKSPGPRRTKEACLIS
eukprot:TRINITY_DN6642_c0_g1_i1.p1 TRINITY_DN6642_c0_g1~~TRINITY_DN6642_c0_g1_i1.p1  ORF type:complete len:227 (-),score=36.98 TRINITY_DN6642_c0_g1_i1:101-781(-)